MRLSKWSYVADFVVYPLLLVAAAGLSLRHASMWQAEQWFALAAVGVVAWTAIEYALHRWLLHHVPPFKRLHAAHHARPAALIGTPTWVSAPLFLGAWALFAHEWPRPLGGGFAAGLMFGYLAYAIVHDAVHHRRAAPGTWLHGAKLRHARHHRVGAAGDFGVSTDLWDRLFGSASAPHHPASTRPGSDERHR
jgi:sterol desaturase/sphingolipid hydroxylase (fatty acid hydroxylase superfamily)